MPCSVAASSPPARGGEQRVERGLEVALLGDATLDRPDLVGALDAIADLAASSAYRRACRRAISSASPAASSRSRAYSPIVCSIRSRSPWPSRLHEGLVDERLQLVEACSRRALRRPLRRPRACSLRRRRPCAGTGAAPPPSAASGSSRSWRAASAGARERRATPDVSTSSAWSSRSSSASGDRSRSRAAASSSASGRPSRRRQTAATAAAFSGVSSNEPLVVIARSTNRATAGYARATRSDRIRRRRELERGERVLAFGGDPQRRPARGDDPKPRAALDQARHVRSGRPRPARGCPAAAAPSCRRSARRRHRRASAPSASFTSSASARAGTNARDPSTSASATNATPSRNSGASSRPSSTTMRVFPTPPGPVIVTTRCSRASSTSDARSAARPTVASTGSGRLLGRLANRSPLPSSALRIRHDDAVGRDRVELERAPDVLEPEPSQPDDADVAPVLDLLVRGVGQHHAARVRRRTRSGRRCSQRPR